MQLCQQQAPSLGSRRDSQAPRLSQHPRASLAHPRHPTMLRALSQRSSSIDEDQPSTSNDVTPLEPRGPRWLAWLPFLRPQPGEGGWRLNAGMLMRLLRLAALGFMAVAALLSTRMALISQQRNAPKEVLYSDFVSLVSSKRVRSARLEAGTSRLYFEAAPDSAPGASAAAAAAAPAAAAPHASSAPGEQVLLASQKPRHRHGLYVKVAQQADPQLVTRLLDAGVEFGVVKASFGASLSRVLLTALSLWIPLIPLLWVMRRALDARSGMDKRKRSAAASTPRVTFEDVAGCEAAKEELMEVVECLRNKGGRYARVRARMPSGVLLSGAPGTGKTLLAKAVAGEAGVPFISCAASEFVEMFVGRGAARVRELFAEARRQAPCVVFIDELDALGARRGLSMNDERDQTLNQLLTELDGFEGRPGVMLLAATNRANMLDPALMRPGRISRKVTVPLPNEEGRRAVLSVHLRDVSMASGLEREEAAARIATITHGFSGAELANVVNEASLLAARAGQDHITLLELAEGVRRTRYGVDGGASAAGGGLLGSALQKRLAGWLYALAGADGTPAKAAVL